MSRLLLSLLLLLSAAVGWSQIPFSDSLRVSLITCGPGPVSYERFGHSGIRFIDLKQPQLDVVFHYGVFSFDEPNFIYRFVKGETDYQLGVAYTNRFLQSYKHRGQMIVEQQLALDSCQVNTLKELLLENYRPENRTYRYNYFYDNCATRPYHMITRACQQGIGIDSTWLQPTTYRQMVREKSGRDTWLDFGITMAIGHASDLPLSFKQQMFLPQYLCTAFANATLDGHPLVAAADTLTQTSPALQTVLSNPPSATDPMPAMLLVLVLSAALLAFRIRQQKPGHHHAKMARILSNTFDTFMLTATGILGVIVWFLLCFSEHPTVDNNLNCVWLWPTNLLFSVIIWINCPQKVHRIYFLLNFAALIIYIGVSCNGWQESSAPVLMLAASLMLRDIERAYFNDKTA